MKAKLLACKTMEDEMMGLIPPGLAYEFVEYALHRVPSQLTQELQAKLDREAQSEFDTILLGYGLCSNGVVGLIPRKQHLVIPRVHDCISLLLGSRQRYQEEFESEPGTIYLTKGWIVNEGDPLSEYRRYEKQHGSEAAQWVMDQQYRNYKRIVYIDTGIPGQQTWRDHARKAADYLNLAYCETAGTKTIMQKLVSGDWDDDFVVIPPGQAVQAEVFL